MPSAPGNFAGKGSVGAQNEAKTSAMEILVQQLEREASKKRGG